jgi:uncharacterized protein with HEPN domain
MVHHLDLIATIVKHGKARLRTEREPRYALEHAVELVAEAAEKTRCAFKTANPSVPWVQLRRFRAEVAHPYDIGEAPVDLELLWRFARDEAPAIMRRLRRPVFPKDL